MDLSLSGIQNSSNFGLQTTSFSAKNVGISAYNTNKDNSAYYAKKGEPMYMQEMDADEDGVVSFDEFRDYCKENGISTKQMIKMVEMANSYRTMQANEKASKSVQSASQNQDKNSINNIEINTQSSDAAVYAKRGDSKYDEAMDSNSDDKVTYKEYIDYCKEHAKSNEKKSDIKVEETEDGTFKTSSRSKAAEAYAKAETEPPEGKYEYEA